MTSLVAPSPPPPPPPAPSFLAELRLHQDREYAGRIRQTLLDETHRIALAAVAIALGVPLSCEGA